ncbi:MAG: hypothetical protein ACLQBY_09635 [Solirubrobacteraceae bacterium]
MSSPILPIKGPPDLSRATPSAGSGAADISAFVSELATNEATLTAVASRGVPPPEVFDQIAAAARYHEQLREDGHQLRFFAGAPGEQTRIEIHDGDGNAVRTLSTAEALELAAGKSLG